MRPVRKSYFPIRYSLSLFITTAHASSTASRCLSMDETTKKVPPTTGSAADPGSIFFLSYAHWQRQANALSYQRTGRLEVVEDNPRRVLVADGQFRHRALEFQRGGYLGQVAGQARQGDRPDFGLDPQPRVGHSTRRCDHRARTEHGPIQRGRLYPAIILFMGAEHRRNFRQVDRHQPGTGNIEGRCSTEEPEEASIPQRLFNALKTLHPIESMRKVANIKSQYFANWQFLHCRGDSPDQRLKAWLKFPGSV